MKNDSRSTAGGVGVHDMAPRFGGRMVRVEVFINTDRDAEEIARRIHRVAQGSRVDAVLMTYSVYEDGAAWAAVQAVAREAAGGRDPGAEPAE